MSVINDPAMVTNANLVLMFTRGHSFKRATEELTTSLGGSIELHLKDHPRGVAHRSDNIHRRLDALGIVGDGVSSRHTAGGGPEGGAVKSAKALGRRRGGTRWSLVTCLQD